MYCGEGSLVNLSANGYKAVTLRCRAWTCPDCAPRRKSRLRAQAYAGNPTLFVTLTVNPAFGTDQADRARRLADAWRIIVKRAKRKYRYPSIPFLAVFERTKKGEPHLHIIARCKWIGQRWLSEQMAELMKAPVCWVARVTNKSKVAFYVSKYIGKDPQRFGSCKRYWSTQDYQHPQEPSEQTNAWEDGQWSRCEDSLDTLQRQWERAGYSVSREGDALFAWPNGPPVVKGLTPKRSSPGPL